MSLQNLFMTVKIYLYRLRGVKIGSNVKLYGKIYITGKYNKVSIGDSVSLNHFVFINARDKVIIGNHVTISPFVQIYTAGLDTSKKEKVHTSQQVIIESNSWIAANTIITPGSIVRNGAVLAAGSVVIGEVLAHSLYAGAPAKKIKDL